MFGHAGTDPGRATGRDRVVAPQGLSDEALEAADLEMCAPPAAFRNSVLLRYYSQTLSRVIQTSMSLGYEPSLELLQISAK